MEAQPVTQQTQTDSARSRTFKTEQKNYFSLELASCLKTRASPRSTLYRGSKKVPNFQGREEDVSSETMSPLEVREEVKVLEFKRS